MWDRSYAKSEACQSTEWNSGNAHGASVNKSPCCSFLLCQFSPSAHTLLTISLCKSIIQKSHVVRQTTLSGNNAAQLILLIPCKLRTHWVFWDLKGPEWRLHILIPCRTHRGEGGGVGDYWRSRAIVTCVKQHGWMGIGTLSIARLSRQNRCQLVIVVLAAIQFLINAHFCILLFCKYSQQVALPPLGRAR